MGVPPFRLTGVAVCALAVAVPACLLVIFLGIIILVGIFVSDARRAYVLNAASALACVARVLVRIAQGPPRSTTT